MRSRPWATACAQLCALLGASSSVFASSPALASAGIPTFEAFLCYATLAAVYAPLQWRRSAERQAAGLPRLHAPAAAYLLLGCVDAEANYLIVSAFRYTSLTSVTLLDSAAVPVGLALSAAALGARVTRSHAAAAALVLCGTVVLLAGDAACGRAGAGAAAAEAAASGAAAAAAPAPEPGPSRPLLGDALTVAASCMFAVSNALQERLLGAAPRAEVLAAFGLVGAAVSALQALLIEAPQLRALAWRAAGPPLAGFAATVFAGYSLASVAIAGVGSAAFNLHLLCSDLWAAAARGLFLGGFGGACGGASFAGALAVVAAGMALFAAAGDVAAPAAPAAPGPGGGGGAGGGAGLAPARGLAAAGGGGCGRDDDSDSDDYAACM